MKKRPLSPTVSSENENPAKRAKPFHEISDEESFWNDDEEFSLFQPLEQEEINNDDTISTRTRAKLPKLDDMELLNIEDKLNDIEELTEGEGEEENVKNNKHEEYILFLEGLFSDSTFPKIQSINNPNDDDEDDPDYTLQDDEQIESEEYRRDRAVQVSKSEIENLVNPEAPLPLLPGGKTGVLGLAEVTSPVKRSIKKGQPKKKGTSRTQEPARARLFEAPDIRAKGTRAREGSERIIAPMNGIESAMGSNYPMIQPPPAYRPILPSIKSQEMGYFPRTSLFTEEQLLALHKNMLVHAQLIIQTILLAKKNNNQKVIDSCWEFLLELIKHRDSTIQCKYMNHSIPNNSNINQSNQTFFNIPVLEKLDLLRPVKDPKTVFSTDQLIVLLNNFTSDFQNPPIDLLHAEKNKIVGKLKFTPGEDKLLALGLQKFGPRDFKSIHSQFLPTKTIPQLHHRFKNMSSNRKPDNPLKEVKQSFSKLTPNEMKELKAGIEKYGPKFDFISRFMLQQRSPAMLSCAWSNYLKNQNSKNNLTPSTPSLSDSGTISLSSSPTSYISMLSGSSSMLNDHNSLLLSAAHLSGPPRSSSHSLDPLHSHIHNQFDLDSFDNDIEYEELNDDSSDDFEEEELSDSDSDHFSDDNISPLPPSTPNPPPPDPIPLSNSSKPEGNDQLPDNVLQLNGETISWNVDEDRTILYAAQRHNLSQMPLVWQNLSKELGKAADQIEKRYEQLLGKLRLKSQIP